MGGRGREEQGRKSESETREGVREGGTVTWEDNGRERRERDKEWEGNRERERERERWIKRISQMQYIE